MPKKSIIIIALLGLFLTNLFWAGNAVLGRGVAESVPPFTLTFGRWLIAFLILTPFIYTKIQDSLPEIKAKLGLLSLLSLLGIVVFNCIFYLAAHLTTAVNITLTSSTLPLITLIIAWGLLTQRPTGKQLTGILCSFIGIVIIVTGGELSSLLALSLNRGDLLILGNVMAWSLYTVLLDKYPINLNPFVLLWALIGLGLPPLFFLYLIEAQATAYYYPPSQHMPIFFYAAIFPSLLSYLFWGYGIKIVGSAVSALSVYLLPILTALIAIPLLDESVHPFHLIGGVFILAGLTIANYTALLKKS